MQETAGVGELAAEQQPAESTAVGVQAITLPRTVLLDAAGGDGACILARGESYLKANGFLYDVRTDPQNDFKRLKKKCNFYTIWVHTYTYM